MRNALIFCLVLMAFFAGACGSNNIPDQNTDQGLGTLSAALDWDRSPGAIVVRMDTDGSTGDLSADLNTLPFCTLFGDGRVIWLTPNSSPEQVLEARVDEQTIRNFLEYVIGSGFYSWTADEGYILPTPPDQGENPAPVIETITVALFGESRKLDAFSNWPPSAFENILDRCRNLSASPAIYLPQGIWLSAMPVEMRNNIPSIPWSIYAESYPDIDLNATGPDSPIWADDALATFAWQTAREGRLQITHNGQAYYFIAQDPLLHEDAPPAPGVSPDQNSEPADDG